MGELTRILRAGIGVAADDSSLGMRFIALLEQTLGTFLLLPERRFEKKCSSRLVAI
jgi:hypothetical protein